MVKVVIFDFDLTIFDSSLVKAFMDKRLWSLVYKNLHNLNIFKGKR